MANVVLELERKRLIHPPAWLSANVHYLTIMGSVAYGVSGDSSDVDVYGFCIPTKEVIFPHLAGEVVGFGTPAKRFTQWQQHHVKDDDALGGKGREYDLTVFNVVDYFQLLMKNNPNVIDSLFTHETCVLHVTRVGAMVRERRKLFLHKGCWPTFKGYAYAQVKKLRVKERESGARRAMVEKYGFDLKFAYHVVRLLNEVEQILTEGDLDLMRNREQLKAIRAGEWTEQQVEDYFASKESTLEDVYSKSALPALPDEAKIKALLLDVLEEHYGSLEKCVVREDAVVAALRKMLDAADEARRMLAGEQRWRTDEDAAGG